jgi:hypothetical protein
MEVRETGLFNAKTKNWIQSFLQNIQQRVLLEGAASEQAPVLSGVPQYLTCNGGERNRSIVGG